MKAWTVNDPFLPGDEIGIVLTEDGPQIRLHVNSQCTVEQAITIVKKIQRVLVGARAIEALDVPREATQRPDSPS